MRVPSPNSRSVFAHTHCKAFLLFLTLIAVFCSDAAHADEPLHEDQSLSLSKPITDMAWSPDGTKLAILDQSGLSLRNLNEGQEIWKVESLGSWQTHGLAFSPSGAFVIAPSKGTGGPRNKQPTFTLFAINDSNNTVSVRDAAAGAQNGSEQFALAEDDSVLISIVSNAGWLTVYDPNSWKVLHHIGPLINRQGNTASPSRIVVDGLRKVVCVAFADGEIQTWDFLKNTKLASFQASKTTISALAFNHASGELITGGSGVIIGAYLVDETHLSPGGVQDDPASLVRAWDPLTGKLLRSYPTHTGIQSLSVSRDGLYIAALDGGSMPGVHLLVWNARNGALVNSTDYGRSHGGYVVRFSPDAKKLASGVTEDIHFYDLPL
jgi:WD40 repeat protein